MKIKFSVTALALLTVMTPLAWAGNGAAAQAATPTIVGTNVPMSDEAIAQQAARDASNVPVPQTTPVATVSPEQAAAEASSAALPEEGAVGGVPNVTTTADPTSISVSSAPPVVTTLVTQIANFAGRNTSAGASMQARFSQDLWQTVGGQVITRQGSADREICQDMAAMGAAATADQAQRTSNLVAQAGQPAPTAVTGCTNIAAANVANIATDILKSSGFAKKFYNSSIVQSLQGFMSNFPMGPQLAGVVTNVMAQQFSKVLGSLNLGGLGGLLGGAGKASPIDIGQLTSDCNKQAVIARNARCVARATNNPAAGISAEDCFNYSGVASMLDTIIPPANAGAARITTMPPAQAGTTSVIRDSQGNIVGIRDVF